MMNRSKMTKEDIVKIIHENREILEKYKIKEINLFGSFVRGEENENSDIDFLVEFKTPISIFKHVHLMNELGEIFMRKVEVVSFKALKPLIKENILKEAMRIEKL